MASQYDGFSLNKAGVKRVILVNNSKLQELEKTTIDSVLSIIQAQFFLQFGFTGNFNIIGFTTDRSTYKISAADSRTTAILKANPRFLDQFIDNMKI